MKWLSDQTLDHLRAVIEEPDLSGTKYRLLEPLDAGGMSVVFAAEDTRLRRRVALKVLNISNLSPEMIARMTREAQIVAQLEHPGIVPVHDLGVLPDGRVFYVMKLVKGERLDHHVQKIDPLPERLRLFQKVCDAVAFAHSHGVIHRDLKPQNIMVGEFGEVLVMDWGVAKLLGSPENTLVVSSSGSDADTQFGTVIGTPGYMAPEQARGDVANLSFQSDVFSLGAVLYFLLTGASPPGPPPRRVRTSIPRPLEAICLKAMAEESMNRYDSVSDFASDLARFLDNLPVKAYRENLLEKTIRWVSRNWFVVILVLTYMIMRFLIYLVSRE